MSFLGWNTIYGADGDHDTPYLFRLWFGPLRLHVFHRGDEDPDPHDHPWDFWTFPLIGYMEEVTVKSRFHGLPQFIPYHTTERWVKPFRLHYRPAEHTHRVLSGKGKIVTIVIRGSIRRKWGFLKNRDGKWCWIAWKKYVYEGGKHGPCE